MPDDQIHLVLQRPGRPEHRFTVGPGVYTIGSEEGNTLLLPGPDVAWRQGVLTLTGQGDWIEDLGTGAPIRIDGAPIKGRVRVQAGQVMLIGPYALTFQREAPQPVFQEEREEEIYIAPPVPPPEHKLPPRPVATATPPPSPAPAPPAADPRRAVKRQIHTELVKRMELKRLTASRINEADLRARVQKTIGDIVHEVRTRLPAGIDADLLTKEIYDEAVGLGPLEDLLADATVTEIMVNGPEQVYIEREGRIELTNRSFLDPESVHAIIERIVAPIGRRIDESQPYVDARLPDGSRVNAIIPPLSLTGPCLTIRKFSAEPFRVDDLIRLGSMNESIAAFLRAAVRLRKNIIVSGGTGSGKTTMLNVVSSYIPDGERILTIEDAAELRLSQQHVIRLEARPPNIEGRGAITIRDLVRNALRMRPDRIVVGECRGGEALDMLQAMNTGHEGSLTTVHANSPRDVISRLETMVLMSGLELPVRAIREQIGAAIHLILHTSRYSDGSRKVARVTEVVGLEGDQITMQDIFVFQQTGVDARGRVAGAFKPTGSVPTFVEDLAARGLKIDHRMFDPSSWMA